jgi:hypothetical protein
VRPWAFTRIFPSDVVRTFTRALAEVDADAVTAATATVPAATARSAETTFSRFFTVPPPSRFVVKGLRQRGDRGCCACVNGTDVRRESLRVLLRRPGPVGSSL